MGGGSYSYVESRHRATILNAAVNSVSADYLCDLDEDTRGAYAAKAASTISQTYFTSRSLDDEMNISGKIRESCDSEEHPTSFPIIIALDVTGSMSNIPAELIANAFPEIMKSIMDAGVEHAQVCFVGIGDDVYDRAPVQIGQFETSDELTEKWLKKLYLERGGGGNFGESYGLAWYTAINHTRTDSFDKRGKKGCLITIGDEPCLKIYSRHSIKSIFGDDIQSDVKADGLYKDVSQKWDVYHVDAGNCKEMWEDEFPGLKVVQSGRTTNSISAEIIKAIIASYKGTPVTQKVSTASEDKTESKEEEIIL